MLDLRTVFTEYVVPATLEQFADQVRLFNAASRNTIILNADNFRGDFLQQAFFDSVRDAQYRIDMYAQNDAADVTDITDSVQTGVKVAGGFGPIRYEPAVHTWLKEPTGTGLAIAAQGFSEALLSDQINTAVGVAVAAISGQGAATVNGTDTDPLTYTTINMAHAKFGAASGAIIADIMTGIQYHKFVSQNLANAPSVLFRADNVTVVDILGKAVVVVDAPGLTSATGVNRVLGLTRGAVTIGDSDNLITNVNTSNGKKIIETTFQANYNFNVKVKGYTWDTTTGGKSPLDAELFTSANWPKFSDSIKSTAGVLAIGT